MYPATAWGDYNNDTKTDHFISGDSDAGKIAKLYSCNLASNTAPEVPTHLSSDLNCNSITLKWLSSADAENATELNTYNFYIGTESGLGNRVSPNADIITGTRYINQKGNALYDTIITITNLASGTYYWSVQTLDANNLPSDFAAEESFTIEDLSIQITNQPDAPEVCLGVDTAVSVIASGAIDSYLWQYSKDGGSTWIDTSGTEARFPLDHLTIDMNSYQFRCIVSSHCETLISNEVELVIHSLPEQPVITPDGNTLYSNIDAEYNAYQWYNESVEITGETNSSYMPDADGTYYVEVSSVYGCLNMSDGVFFNYLSEPEITTQPDHAELCENLDTAFTVIASGDEITYQWQLSEDEGGYFSNIDGTSNRLELNNIVAADSGNLYRCIISNDYYEIISDSVELIVHENPSKPTITETEGVLSSTSATSYQWYNNSTLIDDETSISYTPTANGDYTVVITNEFGCENQSDVYNFVLNSINDNDKEFISVYPNPVNQHLTIQYQNKPDKIYIYNNTGSLVLEKSKPDDFKCGIDVSQFSRGVYLVSIKYTDKSVILKFIIE